LVLRPGNEFNAHAVMPEELQRRLLALALSGNESIMSAFTAMADRAGLTENGRAKREREIERYQALTRMVMATQERISEFQKELDRLERASYEALVESEEKLREARKELERIRERAYEIPMPDGTRLKVYRDGDVVRDEADNIVSAEIIKVEDLPDNCATRDERRKQETVVQEFERNNSEAYSDYARVQAAKEGAAGKNLTDQQVEELDASVEPVRRRLDEVRQAADQSIRPPRQDVSTPGPG
jgi:hypothetical protein